jgi:hypothetical protein
MRRRQLVASVSSALKEEALYSSEMSVYFCQTTRRHNPQSPPWEIYVQRYDSGAFTLLLSSTLLVVYETSEQNSVSTVEFCAVFTFPNFFVRSFLLSNESDVS